MSNSILPTPVISRKEALLLCFKIWNTLPKTMEEKHEIGTEVCISAGIDGDCPVCEWDCEVCPMLPVWWGDCGEAYGYGDGLYWLPCTNYDSPFEKWKRLVFEITDPTRYHPYDAEFFALLIAEGALELANKI